MRFYLAAAFHRKAEMKALSLLIISLGLVCTSRWLDETQCPHGGEERKIFLCDTAKIDFEDVKSADMLIRFSDDLSTATIPSRWATGGRLVETGLALAWGKRVVVVGGHQPIFDHLPQVVHIKDEDELLTYLRQQEYI